MGKKKRSKTIHLEKKEEEFDSDDERAYEKEKQPNKKDESFYHDDVDTFLQNRDKLLLDGGADIQRDEDSSDNEEEVLGLASDSGDELDIDHYEKALRKFQDTDFKDELASDLEEERDGMPESEAWGLMKRKFYGADVGDYFKIDPTKSAPNAALLEEQEALAMQKKMAQQLDDQDFDLDLFQTVKKTELTDGKEKKDGEQKIEKDLTQLTKKQQLKLLNKESPELLQLIEEYKSKIQEVQERFLPIQTLVRNGKLPRSNGADYIESKIKLYLNYCINISFYVMMKAKRTPIQNHPVIKRIVQYRNLIRQMEAVDSKVADEINSLLEKLKNGEDIQIKSDETFVMRKSKKLSAKRKLRENVEKKLTAMLDDETGDTSNDEDDLNEKQKAKKLKREARAEGKYETKGERQALEYYDMMKGRQGGDENDNIDKQPDMDDNLDEGNSKADNLEGVADDTQQDGVDGRRAINYQIAKNKGLTPKRKKEQRNPRVKHRNKYKKAINARRGQVREVRTEMSKYGGELSGIKVGITKSVKFK